MPSTFIDILTNVGYADYIPLNNRLYLKNCSTFDSFYWTVKDKMYSLTIDDLINHDSKGCYLETQSIPLNADGIEWVLNSYFFMHYCISLDFDNGQVGLAKMNIYV